MWFKGVRSIKKLEKISLLKVLHQTGHESQTVPCIGHEKNLLDLLFCQLMNTSTFIQIYLVLFGLIRIFTFYRIEINIDMIG